MGVWGKDVNSRNFLLTQHITKRTTCTLDLIKYINSIVSKIKSNSRDFAKK